MKRTRGFLVAACALTSACWDPFGLAPDVKLPISELTVAETTSPQGPLSATVTVVTGGCREFDRITSTRKAAVVIVEAWGKDDSGKLACTDDIKYEPHQHSIAGPFTDPLIISAVQPDGTAITKTVKVQ